MVLDVGGNASDWWTEMVVYKGFSVGAPLDETMGRPGLFDLCILGRR